MATSLVEIVPRARLVIPALAGVTKNPRLLRDGIKTRQGIPAWFSEAQQPSVQSGWGAVRSTMKRQSP